MTVSFSRLDPPSETTYLRERVARLRSSLDWAGDAISPSLRARVSAAIERIDERLKLGVDSTIVALAGGTGSGKSSLFNAITRTDFAIAGVSRPTTAHVSAATWAGRSDALLTWLGVTDDRRVVCDIVPDSDEQQAFRGLVLLDLPDHDSVDGSHRETVDRVAPMADLIIWVVDPQKYADNALHSRYLAGIAESGAPSAVVLNQIDRLTRGDADAIMFDIRRLLADKGIETVPVLVTSVTTGAGIDSLRSLLASVVKKRSVAAEAVRSDLVATGRELATALAKGAEPWLPSVDDFVARVAAAAGVDALAEAANEAAQGSRTLPPLARLTAAALDPIRSAWIDSASAGLPRPWRRVLESAIVKPRALAETISGVLDTLEWPPVPAGGSGFFRSRKKPTVGGEIVTMGRAAIRAVIEPDVLEPTVTVHQAYRALDELTDLTTGATLPQK